MTGEVIIMYIIAAVAGYLLGSANSSLIVGRFYGVDVRQHGSGNAGATNTFRTLGKTAAILTTAGDIIKGIIASIIGMLLVGRYGVMVGGIAAVIGHNWPVYFRFRGGKGVLTSLAVVFMIDWQASLIVLCIFIPIVAVTRYVSLGSMVAAVLFPVVSAMLHWDAPRVAFSVLLALLVLLRHRSNLQRIIKGTESKLGKKK